MDAVTPRLPGRLVLVAADQPQYQPVKCVFVVDPSYPVERGLDYNTVIMAFQPNEMERKAIAEGGDVYVGLLTFGHPQQPIVVAGGVEVMAHWYGLTVLPTEPVDPRLS